MPPPKATAVFSSRLSDGDPSQRYMDLFIALSVLEKLEVSYTKSLLSMDEYEKELAAGIKQARKAHRMISNEFPSFEDFAKEFGCSLLDAGGKRETHEFHRAIVQLEGGQDLIGGGERNGSAPNAAVNVATDAAANAAATGDAATPGMAGKMAKPAPENQPSKPGALMAIWDVIQDIKECVDAYAHEEDFTVQVGRVRCHVTSLVACLGRLDERALARMTEDVERIKGWQSRLDGMESRHTIDSQSLVEACSKLKLSMKQI